MEEVKMCKTNFITLVNSYSDSENALDLIETNVSDLNRYVSAVYAMRVQVQTLRFRLKGEGYREAVTNLDRRRRDAHEAAVAACPVLNQLANLASVEPLYSSNLEDRNEMAEFRIAIVGELFHGCSRCTVRGLLKELKQVGGGIITCTERENRFGVLKTYSGHGATLTVQTFEGASEVSCRLIHRDAINSPHAMFNTSDGELQLSLDFHNLYTLPDEQEKIKVVVDDMLALWSEYLNTLG